MHTKPTDKKAVRVRKQAKLLERASELASDTVPDGGVWTVYEQYEIATYANGTRCIRAPRWGRDGVKVGMREYQPLAKYGDLFLQFGRIADTENLDTDELDSKKNEIQALRWCEAYGALGVTSSQERGAWWGNPRGGHEDTVEVFAFEALVANALLRLYESATRPEGADVGTITSLAPPSRRDIIAGTSGMAQEWAQEQVLSIIRYRLEQHTCVQLYSRTMDYRFINGAGFRSLLGAIYLSAAYLLHADRPSRCRRPGCPRIISFKQPEHKPDPNVINDRSGGYRSPRSDKEYCCKKCADAHYYERITKPLRQARARRKSSRR